MRGAIFSSFRECLQPPNPLVGHVCVSAYICKNAPVYGDVSVHMLVGASRKIANVYVSVCVCEREREGGRTREEKGGERRRWLTHGVIYIC